MAKKDEHSSKELSHLASEILSGRKKPTTADAKRLAGGVLTNAPDKPKPSSKKSSGKK